MSRIRLLGVSLVVALLSTTAVAAAKPTITMSGSTSVYPLAQALAKGYLGQYPGRARFKLFAGGSDVGIDDVAHGRVDIGNSSRDPQGGDPAVTFNKIARDAVCVVTNKRNGLHNISQKQVQAIFSGRIRNWSKVRGSHLSGPIKLITRTAASGTHDAFQSIFMGQALKVASSAAQKTSNGLVRQSVRSNSKAIGYVSLDFTGGVRPLSYKGIGCTLRNAKSGQYGGTRNFFMVTRGRAGGATGSFLGWVRGSSRARQIIGTHWVNRR